MRIRARYLLALVVALGMPALAAAPTALAKDAAPAPSGSAKRYDPKNQTALSEVMATCIEGNKQYAARDFKSAIATYRKAITLDPKNALPHYLIGEAQLADGNLAEAEAAWKQAELVVADDQPVLKARILFVKADLLERTKRWPDAKTAWQAYADLAAKLANSGLVFPGSAQSRIQAIDAMTKLNAESDKVKQRIHATADGGVFTNPSASSKGAP